MKEIMLKKLASLEKEYNLLQEQKIKLELNLNQYTDRLHQLKGGILSIGAILEEHKKGEKTDEIPSDKGSEPGKSKVPAGDTAGTGKAKQ